MHANEAFRKDRTFLLTTPRAEVSHICYAYSAISSWLSLLQAINAAFQLSSFQQRWQQLTC